jgi:hypothetical protein
MDAHRFDTLAKLFAQRRLSRRGAVKGAGAGLAAGVLGSSASAQDATPPGDEATPVATDTVTKTAFLFVQSFQSGTITPKDSEDDRYTLTLEAGLGQTIYFSDRPERIVGATPTPQFLAGLGFPDDNPPNAALVVETGPGETDIAVVELFTRSTTRRRTRPPMRLRSWQTGKHRRSWASPRRRPTWRPWRRASERPTSSLTTAPMGRSCAFGAATLITPGNSSLRSSTDGGGNLISGSAASACRITRSFTTSKRRARTGRTSATSDLLNVKENAVPVLPTRKELGVAWEPHHFIMCLDRDRRFASIVKRRQLFQPFPLVRVMTKDHQPDLLPFHQIE